MHPQRAPHGHNAEAKGKPTRHIGSACNEEVQPFLEGRLLLGTVYITDGLKGQPAHAKQYGLRQPATAKCQPLLPLNATLRTHQICHQPF